MNTKTRPLALLTLLSASPLLTGCADPIDGDWRLDRVSGLELCSIDGEMELEANSGDFRATFVCGYDRFETQGVIEDYEADKPGEDYELDVQYFTGSSPFTRWDCELDDDGEELRCDELLAGTRTILEFSRK